MEDKKYNVDINDPRLLRAYIDQMNLEKRGNSNWNKIGRIEQTYCVSPNHHDEHPSMIMSYKNGVAACHCFACGFHATLPKLVYINKISKAIVPEDEMKANIKKKFPAIIKIINDFNNGVDISDIVVEEYKSNGKKYYGSLYKELIQSNSFATDFLISRGISGELASKLGILKKDTEIIIPHSMYDYSVRNIDAESKNARYKHCGTKTLFRANGTKITDGKTISEELNLHELKKNIYNLPLSNNDIIPFFVTEGELNAISIMEAFKDKSKTADVQAVALGGVSGYRLFCEEAEELFQIFYGKLKNDYEKQPEYVTEHYPDIDWENLNYSTKLIGISKEGYSITDIVQKKFPFVLALDNDNAGYECAMTLSNELKMRFGITPYIFPLPEKYNDANDWLMDNKEQFQNTVERITNILYGKDEQAKLDLLNKGQRWIAQKCESIKKTNELNDFKNNNKILNTYLYNGIEIYDYLDTNNVRHLGNQVFSFDIKYFGNNDKVDIKTENDTDIFVVTQHSKKYNKDFVTKYKFDFEENKTINISQIEYEKKKLEKEKQVEEHNLEIKNKMIYCEYKKENELGSNSIYIYPNPDCITDFIMKNCEKDKIITLFTNDIDKKPLLEMNGHYIDTVYKSWNDNPTIANYNKFAKIPFEQQVQNGIVIKQVEKGIGVAPDEDNPEDKKKIINDYLLRHSITNPDAYLSYRKAQMPLTAECISESVLQIKDYLERPEVNNYLDLLKNRAFISNGSKYTILDLKLKNGQINSIIRDSSNGYKYILNDLGRTVEQNNYYTFGSNLEIDTSYMKKVFVDEFEKLESKQKQNG